MAFYRSKPDIIIRGDTVIECGPISDIYMSNICSGKFQILERVELANAKKIC